jgi:hypothetical protein
MIRLILAHKFMEGSEEKLLKSQDKKLGKKYSKNHEKNIAPQYKRWFNPKAWLYWCKSRVYKVQKLPQHPPTL